MYQPRPGYRFSTDPILLAGWLIERGLPSTILDVGTGSGVLGLLLARCGATVTGLDVQAEWCPWARRSAHESGLSHRYRFEVGDIRTRAGPRVELVVSNPPYFSGGTGPASPDPMRAAARHTLHGDLAELLPAMARHAERVAVVLPLSREAEARALLKTCGRAEVHALRLLPRLVLLEARHGTGPGHTETTALRLSGDHHPRVAALYAAAGAPLSRIHHREGPANAIDPADAGTRQEECGAPMVSTRAKRST